MTSDPSSEAPPLPQVRPTCTGRKTAFKNPDHTPLPVVLLLCSAGQQARLGATLLWSWLV